MGIHQPHRPYALDPQIWRCGICGKQWDDTADEEPVKCVPRQEVHLSRTQIESLVVPRLGLTLEDMDCAWENSKLVIKEKPDWRKDENNMH